jgi:signal transduction histidine kinase
VTRLRALVDATIGRRLLVRIWLHGVLLFFGIVGSLLIARFVLPGDAAPAPPHHSSLFWHAVALHVMAFVIALLFVAMPLSRSIARPLERLTRLARELGDGNLAVRADATRRDEIGDLARAFNDMAAQIQRLRSAERHLLADVSHELRTPLARMRVVLDLASDGDPADVRRYLGEITSDLSELEQLLADVIASSRLESDPARWDEARPPLRRSHVDVGALLDASAARMAERWPMRRLERSAPAAAMIVDVDPVMLRRALDNLLDNARKFSPDDRPIGLAAAPVADGVRIEVRDHGIGIAADDLERVFVPFFRADPSRDRATGGVGLGLALARRIVEAHGGRMGVDSVVDQGSRFWLELPTVHSAS